VDRKGHAALRKLLPQPVFDWRLGGLLFCYFCGSFGALLAPSQETEQPQPSPVDSLGQELSPGPWLAEPTQALSLANLGLRGRRGRFRWRLGLRGRARGLSLALWLAELARVLFAGALGLAELGRRRFRLAPWLAELAQALSLAPGLRSWRRRFPLAPWACGAGAGAFAGALACGAGAGAFAGALACGAGSRRFSLAPCLRSWRRRFRHIRSWSGLRCRGRLVQLVADVRWLARSGDPAPPRTSRRPLAAPAAREFAYKIASRIVCRLDSA